VEWIKSSRSIRVSIPRDRKTGFTHERQETALIRMSAINTTADEGRAHLPNVEFHLLDTGHFALV
jgi:hypothetical protein